MEWRVRSEAYRQDCNKIRSVLTVVRLTTLAIIVLFACVLKAYDSTLVRVINYAVITDKLAVICL